jgi:uncharacterized protein YfaP (DUF2135 family)
MKQGIGWLFLALIGGLQAEELTLDAPNNGWRAAVDTGQVFTQPVNYPAVSAGVAPGSGRAALIAGRLNQKPKTRPAPATLVVNGVAMPQALDERGEFARSYAFNQGSNSLILRTRSGAERKVQFYDAGTGRSRPRLRVVLSWDSDGTDLDLHVVSPDGQHVWYGDRVVQNGGALDVDVTTGYGPEIYANPAPVRGPYLVYVNYYGGDLQEQQPITVAQISIIREEGSPNEQRQSFKVPLRRPGELTLVQSFVY